MKKKILSFIFSIMCVYSFVSPAEAASALPFTDVSTNDWYYDAVAYVYSVGLMQGRSSTTFSPEDRVSREDTVVTLGRLAEKLGKTVSGYSCPFTDVKSGSYYYKYVCWAYQNGIVKGTSSTTFGVGQSIIRQDFCVMLERFVKQYLRSSIRNLGGKSSFSDSSSIASYAKTSVISCGRGKIVNEYSGYFRPYNNLKRGELAYMLTNYIQFHVA